MTVRAIMLQIILDRSNRLPRALDKRIYCATCRFCAPITLIYEALHVAKEKLVRDEQSPLILYIMHREQP